MKKIIKFLCILICILLLILLLLKGYQIEQEDIAGKMGSKVGESELSMTDYYNLVQIIENTYKDYLIKGDYNSAYSMLNINYRSHVSFDDYKEKMQSKDNSNLKVTGIKRVTQTTYHVTTNSSGDDFTIILDKGENKFLLLPESFLGAKKINNKVSHNKLKCILEDYLVKVDETQFNIELTNSSKEEMHITGGKLYTNLDDEIEVTFNITIPPKETKEIFASFRTDYAFPKKFILYRANGEKEDLEYVFDIKE